MLRKPTTDTSNNNNRNNFIIFWLTLFYVWRWFSLFSFNTISRSFAYFVDGVLCTLTQIYIFPCVSDLCKCVCAIKWIFVLYSSISVTCICVRLCALFYFLSFCFNFCIIFHFSQFFAFNLNIVHIIVKKSFILLTFFPSFNSCRLLCTFFLLFSVF